MKQHRVILAVNDTTTLNYSAHSETTGLGPINTSADGAIGLHLHSLIAFSEQGTPEGLLHVQCWAREPGWEKKKARKETPLEEKESYKWMKSYAAAKAVQSRCPETKILVMGDRESDIYELFAEARDCSNTPGLVLRAERSRKRQTELGKLWEVMPTVTVAGEQELSVPSRGTRKARVARMQIRFAKMDLLPPRDKSHLGKVPISAVYALEQGAPLGNETIEWMILATEPVADFHGALRVLRWYTQRWGIEVFHRTIKSGCRIEDRQLGTAEGLEACLAVDLVVARRIQRMTMLSREKPDLPCTSILEDAEWKALVAHATQYPLPPPKPPTTRAATRMIGALGGFLGRKGDGEPGATCVWRGLQRLAMITVGYTALWPYVDPTRIPPRSAAGIPVSSDDGCG
jgi:hypothetical protein